MEHVRNPWKAKKNILNFVKNKLGPILSFRGSNWAWKSKPLHLNNWAANMGFALCNWFNQVDQTGLIKAHPFLLSSNCIYQWKLLSYFICTKKKKQLLVVQALGSKQFLSFSLHCSSFFSLISILFFLFLAEIPWLFHQ